MLSAFSLDLRIVRQDLQNFTKRRDETATLFCPHLNWILLILSNWFSNPGNLLINFRLTT